MLEFSGAYTALVTPFKDGRVNKEKLTELVEFQISEGIDGIVPCGTTGESPTLSHEEHRAVINHVIKIVNGRVPVIAGTGSNSTHEAIELTHHAKHVGADGALMITPYYNKPSQAGLLKHFSAVAEAVDIPIILYNCPGRTAINLLPDTVVKLSCDYPGGIVGIKEASGNLDQAAEIVLRTSEGFTVISGDDSHTLPIMSVGGKGVISVMANLYPGKMHEMTARFLNGNIEGALEIHRELFLFGKSLMKIETNPSPIKAAMNIAGHDVGPVRLPLADPSPADLELLKKLIREIKV